MDDPFPGYHANAQKKKPTHQDARAGQRKMCRGINHFERKGSWLAVTKERKQKKRSTKHWLI